MQQTVIYRRGGGSRDGGTRRGLRRRWRRRHRDDRKRLRRSLALDFDGLIRGSRVTVPHRPVNCANESNHQKEQNIDATVDAGERRWEAAGVSGLPLTFHGAVRNETIEVGS